MHIRLVLLISMIAILFADATIQPVRADTAPDCPVLEEGTGNTVDGICSTVSGGQYNSATATYATIGGGNANSASNLGAAIGAGHSNHASGYYATISAGYDSEVSGDYGTVGGGQYNSTHGNYGTVAGGHSNSAGGNSATIGGGYGNSASDLYATVGGGYGNAVTAQYGTIAGGGQTTPGNAATSNRVTDNFGTVGGGGNNQAGNNAGTTADRPYATVGGGRQNSASGSYTSILGGYANTASGASSSILGGSSNTAVGSYATVLGGRGNQTTANYTLAAGYNARAQHAGAFVWADSINSPFTSSAMNQFSARSTGGARFVTAVNGSGTPTAGVTLAAGGGAWSTLSDRNAKANFAAVDSASILEKVAALPVQVWNYKTQETGVKHIGPMAQDFANVFGVGENNTTISTVDADGVALAAIQGLNQKVDAKGARITVLEQRLAILEATQTASNPLLIVSGGLTLSWSMVALGAVTLIVLLIMSSVSMTLLILGRRDR